MKESVPEPDPSPMERDRPGFSKRILLASVSAMAAETATFPIDLTKTRLQLQRATRPTSAVRVASEIVRRQGPLGLYLGLSPAVLRHLFYTPTRIVGYESLRGLSVNFVDHFSLPLKAFLGGTSGVIAQLVASPADLVKVRMQADGRLVSQGLNPRYSSSFDAFTKIVQSEGVRGLWRGVIPNIQRAFLVNMGELACYDHAKTMVIRYNIAADNVYAHTLASLMSGLCATTLSCPADVVKTRMMNQDSGALYKSSIDCLVKTTRVEGLGALWKGFFPTWARLGPWQFVFWVSYEKLRQAAGLSSF